MVAKAKKEDEIKEEEPLTFKEKIFKYINFRTRKQAKTAKRMLIESREKYRQRKPCKWFTMMVFMIAGSVLLITI